MCNSTAIRFKLYSPGTILILKRARIGSEESLTLPNPTSRLGVLFYEDFGL